MASEWGQRLAVITKVEHGFVVLSPGGNHTFLDLASLEKSLGWSVSFDQPKTKVVNSVMIGHLPVKHEAAFDIQLEPLATYVKQEGSSVRYAAGYWGLRFTHSWTGAFCPKISTLAEYDHVGPFASKLELNTILAQRNRDLK
jgi:hypothetical protein